MTQKTANKSKSNLEEIVNKSITVYELVKNMSYGCICLFIREVQ